jgi:Na+/H+ antiporter NhaD/arsenite permease-like protein
MKKIFFAVLLTMFVVSLANFRVYAQETHGEKVVQEQIVEHGNSETAENQAVEGEHGHTLPSAYMVIPFIVLLMMIATGPLFYSHFWEKNYPAVSLALGIFVAAYYIFFLDDFHSLLHTTAEYISFIALLSSLFVASGGILIKIDKKSTPMLNVALLFIGSVLANVIGTTGASMVLIRPFLRVNKGRLKPYHVIFFIFLVSNIGGALTPIGDPPLFMGYLKGVSFFWVVEHIWYAWLGVVIIILAIFYLFDIRNKDVSEVSENYSGKIEFRGMRSIGFLIIILISVFIDPNVMSWVPNLMPFPVGIREMIMFAVVYLSFKYADKEAMKGNEFEWEPIREVAYLFIGIFWTMIPALQLIAHEAHVYGPQLDAGFFYWATGSLSGVLDNTPTYVNFFSAAFGKFGLDPNNIEHVRIFEDTHALYLEAISMGAVFFGAMTYIGNGPNFMVKSITESYGLKMPSFFAYVVKYSFIILIPVFTLVWYVLFYGKG